MQRYDLRALKDSFDNKMLELMKSSSLDDISIFIFEIGDFSAIQRSADLVKNAGFTLMNSLKFNEVDWMIVVKNKKDTKSE